MLRASLTALALIAVLTVPEAAPADDAAARFLAAAFDVTAPELRRLGEGQVVSRTLDAAHKREAATLGIVRITTTPARYVAGLLDIVTFKRDEDILQIGAFGRPPRPEDIAALTLEDGDFERLRECRVGDCGMQLPAGAIERFRARVDWRSPGARAEATGLMREFFREYAARYLESGSAALMAYGDSRTPLDLATEFNALLESDTRTWTHVPWLRRHLVEFPAVAEGTTDFVYWSKEQVNRRPVISLTHVAIVPSVKPSPVKYAIASKQIYAMHYYDVSLGVTLLIPDLSSSETAMYVVYLNRSRIDLFDGFFGGVTKRIVSGRARAMVEKQLYRLQRTLRTPQG